MKGMNDDSSTDISNWLGFSLSPHMKMEPNSHDFTQPPPTSAAAPNFYLTNSAAIFDQNSDDFHPSLSVMPLKSDGSLCIMEALSRSHSQAVLPHSSPKLEDFLGGATMAAHHYAIHPRNAMDLSLESSFYSEEHFRQQQQQQNHYYSGYNFYQTTNDEQQQQQHDKHLQLMSSSIHHQIPHMSEEEIPCLKTWMDHHHALQQQIHSNASMVEDRSAMRSTEIQSLSLSMSPGSRSSCITASRQISPTETTECAAMETKKRGAQISTAQE